MTDTSIPELMQTLADLDQRAREIGAGIGAVIRRATSLVEAIEEDNNNHGGLLSRETTRFASELRHEIAKWEQQAKKGPPKPRRPQPNDDGLDV